jgi:cyclic-di-AMP phosphodiesterase PgpH
MAPQGASDSVHEADFRYPGPKPQSREAGIVMLADACEAATRSISEPTPAKIQAMVHHIVTKRFLEEQFADCELTFKDLQIIELHFTRTLVSLYHHRIEYPGQKSAIQSQSQSNNPLPPTGHSHPHHVHGHGHTHHSKRKESK